MARLLSSLTSSQQAQAIALGLSGNLPDANNAYFVQNGTALGSVSGNNARTISQANLPAVNFSVTEWGHQHKTFNDGTATSNAGQNSNGVASTQTNRGNKWDSTIGSRGITTANWYWSGTSNSGVTVASGGSGAPIDITPKSLSFNSFIYLGN